MLKPATKAASIEKTIIIGLDLAKNLFQAHGAKVDGSVAFRKKLTRNQVLAFFAGQPACLVAMEAPRQCASLGPVDP